MAAYMRKVIRLMMLVMLGSFQADFQSVQAGQPEGLTGDEKVILEIVQTFDAAWNRADADAVAALFSPDGEFVSPSGAITSPRAEIKNLLVGSSRKDSTEQH